MILEGYNVADCYCSVSNVCTLEFQTVEYFEEPRFLIICSICGSASHGARTKEEAVHIWNKNAPKVLLG